MLYFFWFVGSFIAIYVVLKHKYNKLYTNLVERNKSLVQQNSFLQSMIDYHKEELLSYKNNKNIIKELNKELLYIFETNNAEFKTILYHYLDKIDLNFSTHIQNNNQKKILEQSKQIEKLEKDIKTQENIIMHLRNKDLDKIVENFTEF